LRRLRPVLATEPESKGCVENKADGKADFIAWTAQQIVEAVGPDVEIVRLVRDRDSIYGLAFDARVRNLGIEQLVIARRSPHMSLDRESPVARAVQPPTLGRVVSLRLHHRYSRAA
jgi:hypothetical protein